MILPPPFEGKVELGKLNIIIGESDSGKSLFLRYYHLVNWERDEFARIVISSLASKDVIRRGTSFSDALKRRLRDLYQRLMPSDLLDKALESANTAFKSFKEFMDSVNAEEDLIFIEPNALYPLMRDFVSQSVDELIDALSPLWRGTVIDPHLLLSEVWSEEWLPLGVYYLQALRVVHTMEVLKEIEEEEPFKIMREVLGADFSLDPSGEVFYYSEGIWVELAKASSFANLLFQLFAVPSLSLAKGKRVELLIDNVNVNGKRALALGEAVYNLSYAIDKITLITNSYKLIQGLLKAREGARYKVPINVFYFENFRVKELSPEGALRLMRLND